MVITDAALYFSKRIVIGTDIWKARPKNPNSSDFRSIV
jgi:hypothetical protein